MDYLKKSLKKLNINRDYEEVDTKIASGWYVEPIEGNTKKKKQVVLWNWHTENVR